jgi:probable HAF family extracellular repeat protein
MTLATGTANCRRGLVGAAGIWAWVLCGFAQATVQIADFSITDLGVPSRAVPGFSSLATAISPNGQLAGIWFTNPASVTEQGYRGVPDGTGGYQLIDLGTVPTVTRIAPMGVNDSGMIAGWLRSSGADRAFATDPHAANPNAPVEIPGLSSPSRAFAVNAGGAVVGSDGRAFLFTSGGGVQRIVGLGDAAGAAFAVNDSGNIAGYDTDASGSKRAFVVGSATGSVAHPQVGGQWSEARAINGKGDIAGCAASGAAPGDCGGAGAADNEIHAFAVQSGKVVDLGVPAGYDDSFALGVSDNGLVVGKASSDGGSTAFLWADGSMLDLSVALAAFDRTHGTGLFSGWNSLISANAVTGSFLGAGGLSGWIVGEGLTADGARHAFFLQVRLVPEPATWVLLLAGVAATGWAVRRRRCASR